MYRNILIPTDGTEITAKAVASAIALAQALGAKLSTITVKEPFPYSAISEMQPIPPQEFYDAQERIALATALAVISVPSVGMRMFRYMDISWDVGSRTRAQFAPVGRAAATPASPPLELPQPTATGFDGSADHSLHEPGYSTEPSSPAISMASRLWQAVTPEPHWCTTSAGAFP